MSNYLNLKIYLRPRPEIFCVLASTLPVMMGRTRMWQNDADAMDILPNSAQHKIVRTLHSAEVLFRDSNWRPLTTEKIRLRQCTTTKQTARSQEHVLSALSVRTKRKEKERWSPPPACEPCLTQLCFYVRENSEKNKNDFQGRPLTGDSGRFKLQLLWRNLQRGCLVCVCVRERDGETEREEKSAFVCVLVCRRRKRGSWLWMDALIACIQLLQCLWETEGLSMHATHSAYSQPPSLSTSLSCFLSLSVMHFMARK